MALAETCRIDVEVTCALYKTDFSIFGWAAVGLGHVRKPEGNCSRMVWIDAIFAVLKMYLLWFRRQLWFHWWRLAPLDGNLDATISFTEGKHINELTHYPISKKISLGVIQRRAPTLITRRCMNLSHLPLYQHKSNGKRQECIKTMGESLPPNSEASKLPL